MRFLLCGIGSIGQRHYKNLQALGHDIAILRSGKSTGYNSDFLDTFFADQKKKGHSIHQFSDFDEAIEQWNPDAVFVTNPNAQHVDTALRAARSGKNLFIEKPVASTPEGLSELTKLVEQNKLTVMVGYNLRFHPLLQKMKELFDDGAIGTALSAHVEVGENIADWHPWEDYRASYGPWKEKGGGVNLCFSHDIDYLYWFLGSPHTIQAVGGKLTPLGGDAEDVSKSLWTFSNGAVASVHLDYWQRPPRRTFHLVGTDGSLLWDCHAGSLEFHPHSQEGEVQTWDLPEGFDRNDMFVAEVQDFIAAVKEGSQPAITLQEGIDVMDIALSITEKLTQ